MKLYRITPLEKKNISISYDVYEDLPNNQVRGWRVEELYRWGVGYRSEDSAVSEWETHNNGIWCDPSVGDSIELEDLISCDFEFDAGFTAEEKLAIEENWNNSGPSWIYDGEHNWQVESTELVIYGPVQIDLIDDDTGEVIEEDVKPKSEPLSLAWQTVSDQEAFNAWPFPVVSGKTGTD
jgi:hypothetical protein